MSDDSEVQVRVRTDLGTATTQINRLGKEAGSMDKGFRRAAGGVRGLSPRVRGNPGAPVGVVAEDGSIPAGAGEPEAAARGLGLAWTDLFEPLRIMEQEALAVLCERDRG